MYIPQTNFCHSIGWKNLSKFVSCKSFQVPYVIIVTHAVLSYLTWTWRDFQMEGFPVLHGNAMDLLHNHLFFHKENMINQSQSKGIIDHGDVMATARCIPIVICLIILSYNEDIFHLQEDRKMLITGKSHFQPRLIAFIYSSSPKQKGKPLVTSWDKRIGKWGQISSEPHFNYSFLLMFFRDVLCRGLSLFALTIYLEKNWWWSFEIWQAPSFQPPRKLKRANSFPNHWIL